MNSLKIKCYNVKGKLNNMEQVQMEYLEMDIWKINEFIFLNEEVEEFTSRWSQNLVNVRTWLFYQVFLSPQVKRCLSYCVWKLFFLTLTRPKALQT